MEFLKIGCIGTQVYEIQAVLSKIGYYDGPIDGIFGIKTYNSIIDFQFDFNLVTNGVVGPNTYRALSPYIYGFNYYKIKKGDNLNKISETFLTSINSIIIANPGINIYKINVNDIIIVPYGYNLIDTCINYSYDILKKDILGLKIRYPFLTIGSIGKSVLGRDLTYIKLGNGHNKVFYCGAHHSLEWITSLILMKFIEEFLIAYISNKKLIGYNLNDIWRNSSIYIVPMVNPDGVDLVLNGLKNNNPYYHQLIHWNNNSYNFSNVWQANIRGVDLNHNYNASWEESKSAEKEYGIFGPGPTRFSGPYPESEPETKSIVTFTRDKSFRLVLAFHSQGEVIYWNYKNLASLDAKKIGENLSRVSGYRLDEPNGIASYAGYKDWFIKEFNRPGFTVEVGKGKNPLPISAFDKIYEEVKELLLLASIL